MADTNLPATDVRLPVTYEAARQALAECDRIDECKDWSDKAAALASYARQAEDNSLHQLALRIQARATRRCGELLKQIPRGDEATRFGRDGGDPPVTRARAAAEAGLSERQRKTALRVANVPEADFERQVEGESPPTVTRLAEYGKKAPKPAAAAGDPPVANEREAAEACSVLRTFAEWCAAHEGAPLARAMTLDASQQLARYVSIVDTWLDRFATNLPAAEDAA